MREREPGHGFFGPPSGKPDRPLVEAALLLAAFFALTLLAFAPRGSSGSFFLPLFSGRADHGQLHTHRLHALRHLVARRHGRIRPKATARLGHSQGALRAGGAFAMMTLAALFFSASGSRTP
jgi:hypothetical protein